MDLSLSYSFSYVDFNIPVESNVSMHIKLFEISTFLNHKLFENQHMHLNSYFALLRD